MNDIITNPYSPSPELGTLLNAFDIAINLIFPKHLQGRCTIISTLKMRMLRHREGQQRLKVTLVGWRHGQLADLCLHKKPKDYTLKGHLVSGGFFGFYFSQVTALYIFQLENENSGV